MQVERKKRKETADEKQNSHFDLKFRAILWFLDLIPMFPTLEAVILCVLVLAWMQSNFLLIKKIASDRRFPFLRNGFPQVPPFTNERGTAKSEMKKKEY